MEMTDMIAIVIALLGLGICWKLLAWGDCKVRAAIAWRRYKWWSGYRLNS